MKINNTFNETEIGPLPAKWQVIQLGNIIQDAKGTIDPRRYPTEEFDYYSIPAYQNSQLPAVAKGQEIRSIKNVVSPGTVLFGKLNPRVPKVWLVESSSPRRKIASTEFIPLIPATTGVDSMFLYYLSWSPFVLDKAQELIAGSTPSRQRVDVRSFLRLVIPLPPLYEQRTIAYVLHTIQRSKKETEHIITATQDLKKSLIQELFTRGIGHNKFKMTELGEIPEEWEVKKIGELKQNMYYGITAKATEKNTNLRMLRTTDIKNFKFNSETLPFCKITEKRSNLSKYYLKKNDIIVSRAGTIGVSVLINEDLDNTIFGSYLIKIIFNRESLDINFIHYYFQSQLYWKNLLNVSGSTIKNINLPFLNSLEIPLPPLSEQQKIADILSAIDNKILIEEKRKELFENLFKTMLNKLMTGQIRVNNLEMIK